MNQLILPIIILSMVILFFMFSKPTKTLLGPGGTWKPKNQPDIPAPAPNKSSFENTPTSSDVVIVFADWCGHCKSSMPEFKKAVELTKNQPGGKVVMLNSDTQTGKEFMKKNGVTGFPSVVHRGKVVNVSRKAEDIAKLTKM